MLLCRQPVFEKIFLQLKNVQYRDPAQIDNGCNKYFHIFLCKTERINWDKNMEINWDTEW